MPGQRNKGKSRLSPNVCCGFFEVNIAPGDYKYEQGSKKKR